jgi:prepilin-type N-terminal cleavage/methylation domain-containing protein
VTAIRATARQRGFTLTELMVVVTLVAVLAVMGIYSFREQISSSKSVEAINVIQALRAAQEAYRAENQEYLNVSTDPAWYPVETYGEVSFGWAAGYDSNPNGPAFKRLGAIVPQPVQYRYRVNAGSAGGTLPTPIVPLTWPTATEPWYVIQARADVDGNGVFSNAMAASFNGEVYLDHEGE